MTKTSMPDVQPRTDADEAQIIANGHLLLTLYDNYSVSAPAPVEDWETVPRACFARVRYSTGVILGMDAHPTERIPLARSVYEHSVTFAWLLIDPERHYRRFLRWEINERTKMFDALAKHGSIAPPPKEVIELALVGASDNAAPEMYDRAVAADKFWQAQPERWRWHFVASYGNVFRYLSSYVHPTLMGLDCFIARTPTGPFVLPTPDPTREADNAAVVAVTSLADALMVSAAKFGWPPQREVLRAFTVGFVPEGIP